MITYQDFEGKPEGEKRKLIMKLITEHKGSEAYRIAEDAVLYSTGKNATITKHQKLLYTLTGQAIPDNFSANHKMKSGLYKRYIRQLASYLLGNGLICNNEENHAKLGDKFDKNLYFYGKDALAQCASFGFWNVDHVDWFDFLEFAPAWDKETGKLRSGARFWQLDSTTPLRVTWYEEDGYTEYQEEDGELETLVEKRPYILEGGVSEQDGLIIEQGRNYASFPIVPLWGTRERQSTLVGLREQIDCYDLIKSGFANDLDEASMLYWTLTNYGGMDDVDLVKFKERMKTIGVASVEGDGASATAHTIDVPYQSRETYLSMIKKDFVEDTQMLNVEQIQAGQVTATQIEAAYEPINEIADEFEFLVTDFVQEIFKLAGIDDVPTFKRSQMKNQLEETQMILAAANYLDADTIIAKLPFLSNDEVAEVLKRKSAEDINRFKAQEGSGEGANGDEGIEDEE